MERSPQAAYDRALREAIAAFESLRGAGLWPERVNDVVVWRFDGCVDAYLLLRGSAEIRRCSTSLVRAVDAAVDYWARSGRRE